MINTVFGKLLDNFSYVSPAFYTYSGILTEVCCVRKN